MRHERDDLVVGHARWSDDADNTCERTSVIRSSDYGEAREPRVAVLIANRDRHSARLATTTEQLAEFLACLSQSHELPHIVDTCKLRLFRENRCLPQQNGVVIRVEGAIEELVPFFDEDVEQVRCFGRRTDVAQTIAK